MPALMNNYTTVEPQSHYKSKLEVIYRSADFTLFSSSITIARECNTGLNSRINKLLEEFIELQDNWDEDDALSPSKIAIKRAKYITSLLENHGQAIYHTAPGPNGEIMLELRNSYNSKSVELIFYNNREFALQFSPEEKPNQFDFNVDILPELLNWLNKI
jgi:hypothetical protein